MDALRLKMLVGRPRTGPGMKRSNSPPGRGERGRGRGRGGYSSYPSYERTIGATDDDFELVGGGRSKDGRGIDHGGMRSGRIV